MTKTSEKIGQLLFIGLSGTSLTAEEKNFILANNIGGVVLFGRNISTLEALLQLTTELHSLKNQSIDKAPLFVGIDMEGGRVARLKDPFTIWPPIKKLGDLDSASTAFEMAENMGLELKAAGINVNFAPCADILTNPKNQVIGDRSLGGDAEQVAKLSSALVRGYIKSGILACPKHFPGHGDTLLDSHTDLPIQKDTDLETLKNRELVPFKRALRARASMIMTAHILFPKIDPDWPATLSKIFVTDILRNEFRYKDLIVTDDLDMKALRNKYSVDVISTRALEVGANMLLYCNEPESHVQGLEAVRKAVQDKKLAESVIEDSYQRVLNAKKHSLATFAPLTLENAKKIIGQESHKLLAQNIKDGVLPKNLSQDS
jgi:beta-N-acetylhexosaminidase